MYLQRFLPTRTYEHDMTTFTHFCQNRLPACIMWLYYPAGQCLACGPLEKKKNLHSQLAGILISAHSKWLRVRQPYRLGKWLDNLGSHHKRWQQVEDKNWRCALPHMRVLTICQVFSQLCCHDFHYECSWYGRKLQ